MSSSLEKNGFRCYIRWVNEFKKIEKVLFWLKIIPLGDYLLFKKIAITHGKDKFSKKGFLQIYKTFYQGQHFPVD